MIDGNEEAYKTLTGVKSAEVVYYYPEVENKLPIVSYYTIIESNSFGTDNDADIQDVYVAVDVWANKPYKCGDIAREVNEVMTADGWVREMSKDMPPEDRVYHKTMRFVKSFNLKI